MSGVKRIFKRNSHNSVFKVLAGFGRSLNRLYENRNHDYLSNGELTVLRKVGKFNPSIIIDGGANTGEYSLLVNEYIPDCQIYSFEPVEDTFKKLQENTKRVDNINSVKKGLFCNSCLSDINLFNSDEHSSLYDVEATGLRSQRKQTIELISGDDFMQEQKIESIDFLKLDIEGAEYDALLGFQQALRNGKIKVVQFEYGYINITTKRLLIDYYSFFEANNYIVGKIFPKIVEFRKYDYKYEDFIGPNFIAVKKTEIELINSLSK